MTGVSFTVACNLDPLTTEGRGGIDMKKDRPKARV